MNCRDALRLLFDVVDNEASESESREVRKHMEHCKKCSDRLEMELKFKKCIEEKGRFSPECDKLKDRIAQQLDAIDQGGGDVGLFPSPFNEF